MLVGGLFIAAAIAATWQSLRVYTFTGTIDQASDLSWGSEIIGILLPDKGMFAFTSYQPSRDHHYVRVFGHCQPSSVQSLVKWSSAETGNGIAAVYNDELIEFVPHNILGDFRFTDSDFDFWGQAKVPNARKIQISGAYNPATRTFLIRLNELQLP